MLTIDVNPKTSCGYHRLVLPFRYLHGQLKLKTKICIFNRLPTRGFQEIARFKAEGYKIVVDVDDFWELPADHYMAPTFKHRESIANAVKLADLVFVTNHYLANQCRQHNANVEIVPNGLPFDDGQFGLAPDVPITTPFVYAAGPSHYPDMKIISRALNEKDVTIAGDIPTHNEWMRIRQMLPNAQYIKERDIESYMRVYDGHSAALAPLTDNPFNSCKSNLKTLEAGAVGIPIIASDVHPFLNKTDRKVVMLAGSASDFIGYMNRIRVDKGYAEDAGARLADHVRSHYDLRNINEIRRQALENLS